MPQQYQDPVLKKIVDLIQAHTNAFKVVYYGDPMRIPNSSLPALIVAKIDTTVGNFSNVEDGHEMRISISVVTDIRDTVSEDKTMVPGINALYNLMEGREPGTYRLKTDSLLYILRHNAELDTGQNLRIDLETLSRIDYGLAVGKRAPEQWSIEGTLELTANFTQTR